MSETLAFMRLVWSRDRKLVAMLVLVALAGTLISFGASQFLSSDKLVFMPRVSLRELGVAITMLLSLTPVTIYALGLFNFQVQQEQLESAQSCCSHWLLRLPIQSWKIALVPIAMKTLWVGICWYLYTFPLRQLGAPDALPLLEPTVSLSTAAIGFLAISWRPFRSGWWRVAAIVVWLATSAALCWLSLIRTDPLLQNWHVLGTIGVCGAYGLAVWLLLHSVRLARTNTLGIIPSTRRFSTRSRTAAEVACNRIDHQGPLRALAWHDFQRARKMLVLAFGLILVPSMVFVLSIGLNGATVFIALMMSAIAAWSVLAGSMYPLNQKLGVVLPMYLVASPIPSYRIAWTRLVASLVIMLPFLLFTLVLFAVCSMWDSNRAEWMRWAASWARNSGTDGDVFRFGLRISMAVVIGSAVAMYGRIVSFIWVSMSGRDWLAAIVFCLIGAMVMAAIIIPMSWVFRYENLDEVKVAAMWWVSVMPIIVAIVLAFKACFAALAGLLLFNRGLAPSLAISRVLAIWATVVVVISLLMYVLIPDPRATLVGCFAATVIFVPLGSVLWMPISVDDDRHR